MLDAVDNARTLLRFGFTSAISFGSAQGIDVPLRDAINAGRVPGPRLLASDRDVGSTGSNADNKAPGSEGHKRIADGPWAVRAAVREVAKAGADVVKIFLDGEALSAHAAPGVLSYTDDEVAAACDEAHARNLRVACHARSAAAVKQAVRHGVDFVGHANFLDDEAVEMLADARDRLFVGPGIAWEIQLLERGHEIGLSRAMMEARGYQRELDETISAVKRLREVGVRLLIGGDYGLSITPHGTNAKDLEYFVDLFGMSPARSAAVRDPQRRPGDGPDRDARHAGGRHHGRPRDRRRRPDTRHHGAAARGADRRCDEGRSPGHRSAPVTSLPRRRVRGLGGRPRAASAGGSRTCLCPAQRPPPIRWSGRRRPPTCAR